MANDTAHNRVTPQGMAMGKTAARLAELGRARLVEFGSPDSRVEPMGCACDPL
jgi:hypothetical protein